MSRNVIIPYNPKLKSLARKLRKQMTLSEILFWQQIRRKRLGVEFHRQVPIVEYIVDFYCHEIKLAVEIDGASHNHDSIYINDVVRQKRLEYLGVSFIRITNDEVKRNINDMIRMLEIKVAEMTSP